MNLESLRGARVLVAGWGISGRSVVPTLRELGALVTVTDAKPVADVDFLSAAALTSGAIEEFALVVTSPGFRPDAPVLAAAADSGIPIWGDIEFTWRVDQSEIYGPQRKWLVVTGTNGKTTTTSMLFSILEAAGIPSAACGNIGTPVIDALRSDVLAEVLAVELSSFQLHWAPSVRPEAGVVLNIAEDHLDWHGTMQAYADAKAQVLTGRVGVLGLDDPIAAALVSKADRTVGFRLGEPAEGELGVVGNVLVDNAFADAAELADATAISPAGPAGILDALAAAALARSIGVPPEQVSAGLARHQVGPHRATVVGERNGVVYIDDSKATNPHAARSSLLAHDKVVWVAGGLLKGAEVDELVAEVAPRLTGVVLIGQDATKIAAALARHAPDVPVIVLPTSNDAGVKDVKAADDVMRVAVESAAGMAEPGSAVLLAPAAASLDMFTDYKHRGDSFATAFGSLGS